jgi:hypothetical protein
MRQCVCSDSRLSRALSLRWGRQRGKCSCRPRYHVRYRLGGRAYPLVHGGSFATLREARLRRDLIAGELAAGRNPADALTALTVEAPRAKTLAVWADEWRRSRIDVADGTTRNYGAHLQRILPTLGDRDPHTFTVSDVKPGSRG